MLKKLIAGLGLAAAVAAPVLAQDAKEISFGILSTESNQNLKQDWQPLLADMERRIGVKVNAFFAPDYAGVIEAMRFNKVQVAWLGNKSGIEAVDRANGEVFAQVVNADGSIGYHSLVSVHKDSPYRTIDEVLKNGKSLNFGIGDPNSTSGFLVPSYYIFARNHLDREDHLQEHPRRQPRGQHPGRGQQAGRCGGAQLRRAGTRGEALARGRGQPARDLEVAADRR